MSQKQLGKIHVRKFVDESDAVEFLLRPRFLPADHCANGHNAHFQGGSARRNADENICSGVQININLY